MPAMSWPYHFVDLTKDDIVKRRILLDRYGIYAQLSALVLVLAYQLYRLSIWMVSPRKRTKVGYTKVPNTSGFPSQKQITFSTSNELEKGWRSAVWWLESEVYPGWGQRNHWIAGLCWALWLLFLTVHETGDDYMHVTKRFGHVAASQFPIHYMLSMKSIASPLALAFGTSHEHLNSYHRISGRIIYCFLVMHATLYLNFFAQLGVLQTRLTHLVPFLGALSITLLTLLASTALESVRRWSYRVFFVFHLSIAVSLMPLLFFHAPPLRFFCMEALALFIIDIVVRKLDTVTAASRISSIENTQLVKLACPIPAHKLNRFNIAPGQHIYLSIPPKTVGSKIIYQLLYNPFSIAEVTPKGILLVLRTLNGPTTVALKQLAKLPSADLAINIEGPYGAARHFPNFAVEFDRILLVAGGVGATFILPIYHRLTSGMGKGRGFGAGKVEFVWAVRSLAETDWVANTEYSKIFESDERLKIYVTGAEPKSSVTPVEGGRHEGKVELYDLAKSNQRVKIYGGHKRPNLKFIVDNTFRHSMQERVAVLVCGPAEMARELRANVGRWVTQGRNVWWHDESFGW